MSFWKLVLRSLTHYRGLNLMVLLGVALCSAILSGALVVGDSVKRSLLRNAEARLSKIDSVLIGGERFFTAELADRVGQGVAPILQVEGTATIRGGGKRANQVQLIGVDERFWQLGLASSPAAISDMVAINEVLAKRLDLQVGETVICRIEIPGELSKDAPLSGESETTEPFTSKVGAILGAESLGLYSLRAEQVPRATIYLPLSELQERLDKPGKANLLLAPKAAGDSLKADVENHWQVEDAGLSIRSKQGFQLLESSRVFMDRELVDRARETASESDAVLTYLANKIHCNGKLTPYSMVAGTSTQLPGPIPADLKDDEMVISQWLANDLSASIGDTITLDYYVFETGRKLVVESASFTVRSIEKIGEKGWDQSWTPEFPGIFEVDDLDDWEPGIPIDRDIIRDKDEDYWDEFKATPKAFITLAASRKLFGNRFGDTTSIRFQTESVDSYRTQLKQKLSIADIGLSVRNVAEEAKTAVSQSYDFGMLFASMSFFLILSALVLAALVFVFGIEGRSNQIGLLLATGFAPKKARQLFLAEAVILSVIGAVVGLLGGIIYTKLALAGMSGAWQDAASGIDFVYYVKPVTLIASFFGTVVLALITVWIASRAVVKIKPSQLIAGSDSGFGRSKRFNLIAKWVAIVFAVIGLVLLLVPKKAGTIAEQGMFFGAGFCLTLAGVALCGLILYRFGEPSNRISGINALGRQNSVRRKGRSLAVVGLMAAGVFMVTAINSFRLEGSRGAMRKDSGTGGFSYVGESTVPIYEDLNGDAGRKKYGLDRFDGDFTIIPFRVSNGEDASCLNLNRAQRPRLMGVDPELLIGEEMRFKFTKSLLYDPFSWDILNAEVDGIPAIIDASTAVYALKVGIGDGVDYENTENRNFTARIAAFLDTSILQGNLIISERHFIEQFPDAGGYRYFLLDCEDEKLSEEIATHMTRMFGDRGLEMRPTAARLDEFNAVQNTYLSIFSTLGGLGILLGTIGLAIVVARNVLERRGQLGLMQAIGFTRKSLVKLILAEHWFLHIAGVLIGVIAALVAVLPKLFSQASALPWGLLIGVNLAILLGGLLFCWVAAKMALKGELINALRAD